ncbi:MAG TPA: protein-glutamate O-methyltransferase [Treponemataceae bacterium]|nr:protein-glutamate O-methyltransferase [Treponemataceae bacterium]
MQLCDDLVPLGEREFSYISGLMYDRFGIRLGDQKKVLVAGRLSKRIRQLGFDTFTPYIEFLIADKTGNELSELINRITTNHSYFFREKEHFEYLESVILSGIEKKRRDDPGYPLRIWSAGCATGEEIYSIGMLLREHYGDSIMSMDCGLLATDISLAALHEASEAKYAEAKLRELPAAYRMNYFKRATPDTYTVRDDIKKMVLFKKLNLMSDPFPLKCKFDAIFCRNVMIYFDQKSRTQLVNSLYRYVKPGGHLFIGHSESLKRDECPFSYVKPAIYKKGEMAQ